MKINDIVLNEESLNEGPWDVIKGAAKGAWAGAKGQVGQQGQINRQKAEHEKEITSNNSILYRDWMGKIEPQLQNKDPKYYYSQLKKFVTSQYGGGVGGVDPTGIANNVQDPTTIDDASIKSVINQVTRNYFAKKAGIENPAAPAAPGTPPAPPKPSAGRQRGPNGRFTSNKPSEPTGTPPAPAPTGTPKKRTAKPGTPPAPAPTGTPKKRTAKPGTPPAPAPTGTPPAPAAAPASFDSVKQSLGGLSTKEKQKILTQLLSDLGTSVR